MFYSELVYSVKSLRTIGIPNVIFTSHKLNGKICSLKYKLTKKKYSLQDPSAMPRPTSQDLAGFWDLLQLSIDDVTAKFDELQQIKSNQWQLVESPEKKVKLVAQMNSLSFGGNYTNNI